MRILLSTYDGAAFLREQLDSFSAQTFRAWTLHWRDDGSRDETPALMRDFAAGAGPGRCVELAEPAGHVGVLASYMALLRAAAPALAEGDTIAFADQDDVWLPAKLERAMLALAWQSGPALYCARYVAVDAALRPLGESPRLGGPTAFPAALAQNVATGCTVVLNLAAARLLAASRPPPGTLHDWWSYIVVTAAGGTLLRDETVTVRYRQHGGNAVGVARGLLARARAAIGRGPGPFAALLRAHVAALLETPELLAAPARAALDRLRQQLGAGRIGRLRTGLRRQTAWETWAMRLWLLLG